ncbi:hypothetical protein [Spiroplasma sp. SV19]|nr:hypothetical protein [Spiroplasma sp. SV19]
MNKLLNILVQTIVALAPEIVGSNSISSHIYQTIKIIMRTNNNAT